MNRSLIFIVELISSCFQIDVILTNEDGNRENSIIHQPVSSTLKSGPSLLVMWSLRTEDFHHLLEELLCLAFH